MRTIFGYPLASETFIDQGPRLRRLILSALIVLVPLAFFRPANDPFNTPKLALLMALASLASGVRLLELLQGTRLQMPSAILVPAVVLAGTMAVAWVAGPYKGWSLFGQYQRYQGLLPYLVVILVGVLVSETFVNRLRLLAWAVVGAGAIASFYAVCQYLGVDLFTWAAQFGGDVSVTSTLGNPNFSGGFFGLCLPLAIALVISEGDLRPRASACLIAILGGLIVSFSQGGWAAALGGAAVLAGIYMSPRLRWARWGGLCIAGALALVVVGVVAAEIVRPGLGPFGETAQLRAYWWEEAVNIAESSPIVGRGPNAFAIEVNQNRIPDDALDHGLDFTDDPHSIPLAMLAAGGLLAFLGYLAALSYAGIAAWRLNTDDLLVAGFLAGIVAYFIQSLVSIDELSIRLMVWVFIGGAAAGGIQTSTPKDKKAKASARPSRRRGLTPIRLLPGVVAVCLITTLAVAYSFAILVADVKVHSGVASFREGDVESGKRALKGAISIRPDNDYRHLLGFFLGQAGLAQERAGTSLVEESLDSYSYLDRFPAVLALRDKARLLAQFSVFESHYANDGAETYRRIVQIEPLNTILVSEAVGAWVTSEHFSYVIDFLEEADQRLFERNPGLWSSLALAYAHLGEEAEARSALEKALEANPDDSTAPLVEELFLRK